MKTIVCIAGFGDNASMFEPLMRTPLAREHSLIGMNLPGFGAPPISSPVTLQTLADALHEKLLEIEADVVMAHSVASIIAVLAAQKQGSPIELILSLEGNLTLDDAYFSGSAASYTGAETFRAAFLERLDSLASTGGPEMARYRVQAALADTRSLWELGCDAHAYSLRCVPGEALAAARRAVYFYNPDNLPDASLNWLKQHSLERQILPGASHWPSIDQSTQLSETVLSVLS